ncbi:MAG TPA: F0F1 ATP synthase subunit epsilon [Jatrophihabitans sp.]|jgi:F-type H+-transporting ATPase subunit epsilon|nr:F0F1 ATP synthase subunit epsilon [Jatrophihabitans sp.]
MATTMQVEVVSIEAPVWSGAATALYGRTTDGELGILPGHTPLLGALAPGHPVRIEREEGDDLDIAVHGGFLFVHQDHHVSVLAEEAELAENIDPAAAREALSTAEREDGPDAENVRDRALAQLRAVGETI